MNKRERIYSKFNGMCAYSGTPLESDWQIDHVRPVRRNPDGTKMFECAENENNLVPCQRLINHYKGSLPLEEFRTWYLGGLHNRIENLPVNPRTVKSQKKKEYLLSVAAYFGITASNPFNGVFYFEQPTP
jgi:hypothetical protein